MTRERITLAFLLLLAGLGCTAGCPGSEHWPGPAASPPSPVSTSLPSAISPPAASGDSRVPTDPKAHPRILLTAERLRALDRSRSVSSPAWLRLEEQCRAAGREPISSGYEAWDWANATLDLAMCYAVTKRPEYARGAIEYFRAMLDDQSRVGDGQGGDEVVHHDDGYSIRTRGCFGAIAYDWLHDAPGMTPALRAHAVERFFAWSRWFGASGYNRDEPIANYYMGWFGAVAFAGTAVEGDDPRGEEMARQARKMFSDDVVARFGRALGGGDFPEGWQYGDLVGAVLAIYADARSRPGAENASERLPWLAQSVAYRAHALWPDGKHMFDTGDWSTKPALAPTHALLALATVLPESGAAARGARFLAKLARDPDEEWHWLAAIEDDPSRAAEDPRAGPTSYLARGTGAVLARTDWSAQAVWFALTCAPSLSDHQHLDAGHFEVVRGGDALVVDSGGYGSYSSLSHNVVAVDDGRENDNYSPNQGVWSDAARIERYEDAGKFVYALARYESAYNPAGYPKDHPRRSVTRAEREVIFSRSAVPGDPHAARLVVYDRMTVGKPAYGVTFLMHGGSVPVLEGHGARIVVGRSAAEVTTILPAEVEPKLVREPTVLGDGAFFANDPPEGTTSTRIEVPSPRGQIDRRFLHTIVVGARVAALPSPVRIEGHGADAVGVGGEAFVFVREPEEGATRVEYQTPHDVVRHVIVSLVPRASYLPTIARSGDLCTVGLRPVAKDGLRASEAGVLILELRPDCSLVQ